MSTISEMMQTVALVEAEKAQKAEAARTEAARRLKLALAYVRRLEHGAIQLADGTWLHLRDNEIVLLDIGGRGRLGAIRTTDDDDDTELEDIEEAPSLVVTGRGEVLDGIAATGYLAEGDDGQE